MTLPNFLIIGSAKSGTTSLYSWLAQHPQIYFPKVKEPSFFSGEGEAFPHPKGPWWYPKDLEGYQNLFDAVTTEKAIGEASPLYLYSETAPPHIKAVIPDVKMIAVLRNPVDRASSAYRFWHSKGSDTSESFEAALAQEKEHKYSRRPVYLNYKDFGFYSKQLRNYLTYFQKDQFCIILFEDLKNDPSATLKKIFAFLEVDQDFVPNREIKNPTKAPRNKLVHSFLTKHHPLKEIIKPFFSEKRRKKISKRLRNMNLKVETSSKEGVSLETRQALINEYRDDILDLQSLIERDLSHWLK